MSYDLQSNAALALTEAYFQQYCLSTVFSSTPGFSRLHDVFSFESGSAIVFSPSCCLRKIVLTAGHLCVAH